LVIFILANLNDRSQMGNRDSEIAAIIEDNKKIETRMNGKPVNK
jgi:phospholipase D1/2